MIIIDSREHHAQFAERFFNAHAISTEIVALPTSTGADYQIINDCGSVAVQRKVAVSEMISELDEIMFQIVPALVNFCDTSVLLIEENFIIGEDGYLYERANRRATQMLATSYFGFLETIRKKGVDVVTTRDLKQSLWWMLSMHNYLEKEHYPKHRKFFSEKEQAIGMLTAVTGIGERRAADALKNQSIRAMVGMKSVKGLTEKQNDNLQKILKWRMK